MSEAAYHRARLASGTRSTLRPARVGLRSTVNAANGISTGWRPSNSISGNPSIEMAIPRPRRRFALRPRSTPAARIVRQLSRHRPARLWRSTTTVSPIGARVDGRGRVIAENPVADDGWSSRQTFTRRIQTSSWRLRGLGSPGEATDDRPGSCRINGTVTCGLHRTPFASICQVRHRVCVVIRRSSTVSAPSAASASSL